MKKLDKSEIGRAMQALRKTHSGGRKPRTVQHDPKARYCLCVDCRKARGHYPAHLTDGKKPASRKSKKASRS